MTHKPTAMAFCLAAAMSAHASAGAADAAAMPYLKHKNGRYALMVDGAASQWVMERNWNGDQVDSGLNLTGRPVVLKVRLGTY